MQGDAVPGTQERAQGLYSGELFVRLNGAKLCEPQGTLHGAHPFLVKLLRLEDDAPVVQGLVQPSEAKLELTRNIRRQIRQRKHAAKRRWGAVREAVNVLDSGRMDTLAHCSPVASPASGAFDRYMQQFQRLEQVYKKYVTSNILQLYALLEAESQYITAWNKREEAKCRDQRALTKLLHQFNSFALQLESETSGQVKMWRLPSSDAQRIRCVKAATENIKKGFLSSPEALEVLEVYKIDNRVLLNNFQRFTNSLAKSTPDMKIKGLFCNVPTESVERCIVYGMHTSQSRVHDEPQFLDSQGAEIKVFNRSLLLQAREDAPGTNMVFRARSKVSNGTPLQFPRRFSRYSTLEEMRTVVNVVEGQTPPVLFLGLCRVAMGKAIRVKDNADAKFPDDPNICALHFTNESIYRDILMQSYPSFSSSFASKRLLPLYLVMSSVRYR
ncbi:hypothetical protein V7S43_004445 [Phytophthora oleae]|uniref:Uncharacterized protein n=1 Tax=Phytophthora oleae TaxID=2107226 RepID=A0ABD3FWS2_9STRA